MGGMREDIRSPRSALAIKVSYCETFGPSLMLWRIPSCIRKLYLHSEKAQVLDDPSFSELLIPHLPVDLWQSTSSTVRWGLLSLVVSPLFIQLWFLCSPVVFRALYNLIQERNLTHVQRKLLWPLVPYHSRKFYVSIKDRVKSVCGLVEPSKGGDWFCFDACFSVLQN